MPETPSAAREWDRARRALDDGRYDQRGSECRDLLALWQRTLRATRADPVAAVVARARGWSDDDVRRPFLEGLWRSLLDLVNGPHHPEGSDTVQEYDAADARLVLATTALNGALMVT